MADKKYYLDQAGLSLYDENIKEHIAGADASTLSSANSYTDTELAKLTGGTTAVKEAEHADTADSADMATKDDSGNVITSTYETKTDAAAKLTAANGYTDEKVANLLNNSTAAVDSIMELAAAMEDNADAIEALETICSTPSAQFITWEADD